MTCRGDASAAGLLFQGWDAAGEGSAAIVFDWERSVLEAIYEAPPRDMGATQDPDAEEDDGLRRVGGPVEMEAGDVLMRILLDHSCVEVYLATGEVLSTRIYRSACSSLDRSRACSLVKARLKSSMQALCKCCDPFDKQHSSIIQRYYQQVCSSRHVVTAQGGAL